MTEVTCPECGHLLSKNMGCSFCGWLHGDCQVTKAFFGPAAMYEQGGVCFTNCDDIDYAIDHLTNDHDTFDL